MPEEQTLKFDNYHKGTDSKTPCPKCGALIPRQATGCQFCGQYFRGHAEDFNPETDARHLGYRFVHGLGIALLILAGLVIAATAIIVSVGR